MFINGKQVHVGKSMLELQIALKNLKPTDVITFVSLEIDADRIANLYKDNHDLPRSHSNRKRARTP